MRQPPTSLIPFLFACISLLGGCSSSRVAKDEGAPGGQAGAPADTEAHGGAPSAGASGSGEWAVWGGAAGNAGQGASSDQGAGGTSVPEVKTMGCTGIPKPETIPDDWIEYTGWSCECPVYFVGQSSQPPPPIEWQDCTFPLPNDIACRQVKNPEGISVGTVWGRRAEGMPLLQIKTAANTYYANAKRLAVVGVDGKKYVDAITVAPQNGCIFAVQAVMDERYLFLASRDKWDSSQGTFNEGFVAGSIFDELPSKVMKYQVDPNRYANWAISSDWIVQMRYERTAFHWGEGPPQVVYSAGKDPIGLPGHQTFVIGKDVFVETSVLNKSAVSVWTPAQGQNQLIGWPSDPTQSAGAFGTDGKDMVWTYANGTVDSGHWSNLTVMTAPYSTDPATVTNTQRALRKDKKTFDGGSWAVGCGYAARRESAEFGNGLFVVRLSDGVGWLIPGGKAGSDNHYGFESALGLTCEEVFAQLSLPNGHVTAVRIPLSSLGPGLPPD